MKKLLMLIAAGEAATGLLLLAYPLIVVRVLFASEIGGAGIIMSRIAGVALIGLGVACWPGNSARQQLFGMLAYSTLVTLYLVVVGLGGAAGILLWPAVAVHAVLVILLVRAQSRERKTPVA